MATKPDWMADAVPVRTRKPDWMADAIPISEAQPSAGPKAATDGVAAKVGDWIVDNLMGGVSATIRENARSGAFARDAAEDQGFLDRAGSLLERGAASFDHGIYAFLGALGSEKARQAAADLARGTTGQSVAGNTEWADATGPKGLGRYIIDAGIESAPSMLSLGVPFAGWGLLGTSQTGNIATERAANDARDEVTPDDLWNAAPAAIASTALDKFGFKGLVSAAGPNAARRIVGAAGREGATEGVQSFIENAGGSVGTERGFDLAEALDEAAAGTVAGIGIGGAVRGGVEVGDALMPASLRRAGSRPRQQESVEREEDWEGSLDDLLRSEEPVWALPKPDWMADAIPVEGPPALSPPVAYADESGETGIGATGLADLDRTAAQRRIEAGRPERAAQGERRAAPPLQLPAPPVYVAPDSAAGIGSEGLAGLDRTSAQRRIEAGRPEPVPIDAFMQRVRGAESSGDDAAKNPRSSATGRYQFTDQTWLAMYKQRFGDQGLTDAQILAKRRDGALQDQLMRDLTMANARALRRAGIPTTEGNLYLAHFAGEAGARKLHQADPAASVESVLGQAVVRANPFLKGKTAAEVIAWADAKMGGATTPVIDAGSPPVEAIDNEVFGAPVRPDQPRIARLDTPETSGQDWRLPRTDTGWTPPPEATLVPRAEMAPLPDVPPARRGATSQVTTARGDTVDTQFELRDLSELIDSASPSYDRALQPRDRASRATSDAQVAGLAAKLDPAQLGDSRLASTGAPIIGPDGQVESGNGRVAAIARAYAKHPERAAAYRQMIEARGLDTSGLERPVLVRRRTTEMTPEQRQQWTRAANERDTMAMSSTEQAAADARALPDAALALYRGGPVTAAANRDFVRAFIERAVSPAERNAMTAPDGSLSADGARRIRFALLARAYGDSELIARIAEDTDSNIAAIGKALLDAAPAMARLRARIEAGEVPPQYDITSNIAEAARMVSRSRETGQSLAGMLAQSDAFAPRVSPVTEELLNLFFRDADLRRPRSGAKIAEALVDYTRMAAAQADAAAQGPDLLGHAPGLASHEMLLRRAREKLDGETAAQGDMLAPRPETGYVDGNGQRDRHAGRAAGARSDQGKPDGGPDRAVRRLARGQLRGLGIAKELRVGKAAALVGRPVGSTQELAQIAQVYRDPRYETFRIFYTRDGEIIYATGVSSRSVSEAPLIPESMDYDEWISQTKQRMWEMGADGFYLLHNHPSGEPDPSLDDRGVTRQIASALNGFKGHVVINSNKYAVIDARGKSTLHDIGEGPDALLTPGVPHPLFGNKITNDMHLVMLGKELQQPGWVTVLGTDARGKLRVIVEYPAADLDRDEKTLAAMARRIQRQSGSARLFLVGEREALDVPVVKRALRDGVVTAAVDEDGKRIDRFKSGQKKPLPQSPARFVAEESFPFERDAAFDAKENIVDKLVDKDGITRDVRAIRDAVGNPFRTLADLSRSGFAEMARAYFYTMDARMRVLAKRYNSEAIDALADQFHARAGQTDKAVGETYHEAVDREGFGRSARALRILEPFIGDTEALERITRMLRVPGERTKGRRAEAEAAAKLARLLKDTLEYRRAAGEEIGEVTDGYFPRMLDVEKVVKNRDLFLRNATELYRRHGAEDPRASAEAWMARAFDQYAGLDGGPDFIDLFHDTRPAGVGRKTTKPREFGKDADKLLGSFYDNDTGRVLTAYLIGSARRAEETRRFGGEKLLRTMNRIKRDIRASGQDAGDTINAIARMVATNLGRSDTPSEAVRTTASILHTAGQLGTLDRATITSLSEAMMGFVRGGPKYGLPMVIDSAREFARQIRKAPPSEAGRMAEALGIAHDAMISEALAARAGFERGQTTERARKVQQGFFRATGLHQWTEGTRVAATRMGQAFLRDLAFDMEGRNPTRAAEYLSELGIKDPKAFSAWLREGGNPTPEQLVSGSAGPMERQYRAALMRFASQTIMKPSRAQKPRWASHPVGALFFSLLSFSYGFKKNVLDRAGRMTMRAVKEGDPTLLYPAYGLAGLLAAHTVINNVLRQVIFGGGREDDEEGITFTDWLEAMDRAGLFGAASPLMNAVWGLKYRRGVGESLVGPVIGRPADLVDKTLSLATDTNSPNTNTAERAAAGAIYDIVLEPALEAYGVTRLRGPLAAGVVWGSGNRSGGIVPPDRDIFVDAVAGPKKE